MPSAPQYLQDEFDDDSAAWDVLSKNFWDDRGMIRPKPNAPLATQEEFRAIDYLCLEWDYGYMP